MKFNEPQTKLWVDERQSHVESIFGKQAALFRRAVGLHVWASIAWWFHGSKFQLGRGQCGEADRRSRVLSVAQQLVFTQTAPEQAISANNESPMEPYDAEKSTQTTDTDEAISG